MHLRPIARSSWLLGLTPAILLVVTVPLALANWHQPGSFQELVFGSVLTIACSAVGAVVAARHPTNSIGWLFLAIGGLAALGTLSYHYALYSLVTASTVLPGGGWAAWIGTWLWAPLIFTLGTFLPLLFPTGQPLSSRWRVVGWLAGIGILIVAVGNALVPTIPIGPIEVTNPLATTQASRLELVIGIGFLLVLASMLASVAALVLRFVRSRGDERQQMKWFLYAVAVLIGAFLTEPLSDEVRALALWLATACFPVAVGVAILRYRLYDIDLLINRTLVYTTLTALIVALYALVVGGLGAMLQAQGTFAISLVAAGLVAVLFAPLRDHLQRVVNRVMYGERDEPYRVLARLGQRLEATPTPDAVLPMVVETVAQALKLPYAAIVVQQDTVYMVAAEHGLPPGETTRLPLMYSNEVVGALILAPRGPGEVFTPAERRLLDDLARLVGVVTHAVHLTGELQRSRERLVMTREEERRRLRRDLHDGLGPQLAGFTLRIDAVRNLLRTDLAAAEALLCELSERTQASVADIRRLVYALRPPALDDLGLVAALHQHAAQYTSTGLQIDIVVPEQLPPLPAAVEVAAYRIAQEALTNVVRHSGASTCQIQLAVHDALCLQIWDTGRGIDADRRSGVGLTSIRERAAELGGNCSITARPSGGTIISVQLPLTVPAGTVDGHQQPSGMQAQREGQHDGSANTHSPR